MVLVAATLLCSLVAGFLFAFAVVVMPGIARLDGRAFLRAFQAMDGIIQRGQPLFGLVWLGSVLAILAAAALGVAQLSGLDRLLPIAAAVIYVTCVQLPTFLVNVPLNNEVQRLVIDELDDEAGLAARNRFEARWNRWNTFRTTAATATSALLLMLLLRV